MPRPRLPRPRLAAALLAPLCLLPRAADANTQWAQRGGTSFRWGAWASSGASNVQAPASPPPALRASWPSIGLPALLYQSAPADFPAVPAKTPALLVQSSGAVVVATEDCRVLALPNPDLPGASWAGAPLWQSDAHKSPARSNFWHCYDAVLDGNDNVYLLQQDWTYVLNPLARIFAWSADGSRQLFDARDGVRLEAPVRILDFFSVGMLYTPGQLWVPMSGAYNGTALKIVDIATAAVTTVMAAGSEAAVSGGCGFANPVLGSHELSVWTNDGAMFAQTPFLSAYDFTGAKLWETAASVVEGGIDQPPAIYDVFGRRIFAMQHTDESNSAVLFCFDNHGRACAAPWSSSGIPVNERFALPGGSTLYNAGFIYSAAALYNADDDRLLRLIFSNTLVTDLTPGTTEPVGCLFAILPDTGAQAEYYCLPRDQSSYVAADNYVATAPLIARGARGGPGLDTVFVALFDATIYAFDPLRLSDGPLFSARPLGVFARATVATDFLAMTDGGTLLFPVWDDDSNDYGVVAIPGMTSAAAPASSSSATGQGGGLSPGGAAGVSIVALLLAGLGGAWFVRKAGGLAAASLEVERAVRRLQGGQQRFSPVPTTSYSYGGAGGLGAPLGGGGGGGDGATVSAL